MDQQRKYNDYCDFATMAKLRIIVVQCLKFAENVAFDFFYFDIFQQFLSY